METQSLDELDAEERIRNLNKIIAVLYRWIIYDNECVKYSHFNGRNVGL